jgi:hypothetical protein
LLGEQADQNNKVGAVQEDIELELLLVYLLVQIIPLQLAAVAPQV